MFILTYSSPTTGEVTELFDTRAAADAEAADVRHAMDAVGYGAHADGVRVRDTADMPDDELWELPEDVQARIVAAEWEDHTMTTYTARRIEERFFEYIGDDEYTPGDFFNWDGVPHSVRIDDIVFDSVSDLVEAVRRDYVSFEATGGQWACNPDGSDIIDYATAERESVSWHFDNIPAGILNRVIIPTIG